MKSIFTALLICYAPIGFSQSEVLQDNLYNIQKAVKYQHDSENDREGEDDPGILQDAQKGDPLAQYAYGTIQYQKGNYQEAAKWLLKSAERGHQNAQYDLGKMYEKGDGVEMDYPKAYFLYSLSANQGNKKAAKAKAKLENKLTPGMRMQANKYLKEYHPH